jgi:hypothetical protein
MTTGYRTIIEHGEARLAQRGDTHLGVDWPNTGDADVRCGAAHLTITYSVRASRTSSISPSFSERSVSRHFQLRADYGLCE